ncbi:SoxR reducing system RseC family protein [Aestuariicella hydrocarbonica]|uniref:SoxR reducing system RseC family protein n=1 Tax=Pseudomaricurvus hydrocarbonicus TaxID=1470433 RepID=A0A9E5JU60_9GAMM|nr:SoxR reducing system RseC family protein [Aestuariicella hydrocarbonica]NHO65551.1 SoxR reducing system RseC family protein [Aestuariicella hydrocarbonica]
MITEVGRVVAVDQGCLWVETIQRSTCESCSAEKGCGQSLVAKWGGKTSFIRVLLDGRDASQYHLHDTVKIGIPEEVVARGSMLVYLTPLMALMAGVFMAESFNLSEGGVIVSALAGLLVGGGGVRWHSYRHRDDRRVQPVLMDGVEPVSWCPR